MVAMLFDVYLGSMYRAGSIDEETYKAHALVPAIALLSHDTGFIYPNLPESRRAIELIESFVGMENKICITTDKKYVVIITDVSED